MSGLCYRVPILFVCFCSCIFKVSICLQYYVRDVSYIIFVFSFCFCSLSCINCGYFCFHRQQDLFQVLKAYSILNSTVGFSQAQAPLAAFLLMHMPAEQAFWCLVSICDKYLAGYYTPEMVCMSVCGCNRTEYKNEKPVEFAVWFFTLRDLQNFFHRSISLQLLWFSQWCNWGFWCYGM